MPEGRRQFQDRLQALEQQTLGALDLVVDALDRTIATVQGHDVELASLVIADDDRLDGRYLEVHQGVLSLLALQAPVATDLRTVAALLHVIRHAERMGDQCVNVAKLVPLDGHHPPVDDGMLDNLARMGAQARQQVLGAKQAFAARDVALAEGLVREDDQLDDLNRACFQLALDLGDDPDQREWASHMLLVARCLERIGDHAVDIGEETAFMVTGLFREFTDASHPDRGRKS